MARVDVILALHGGLGMPVRASDQHAARAHVGVVDRVTLHLNTVFPCNIRREGGQSLVILEGREGIPWQLSARNAKIKKVAVVVLFLAVGQANWSHVC